MSGRASWLLAGLAAAAILAMPGADQIRAQPATCEPAASPVDAAVWSNPQPQADDVVLPLGTIAGGLGQMQLTFRKVSVSGNSLFGDEKAVFEAGAGNPTVFEPRMRVRAASALSDKDRQHFLLAGKYEVSVAQYAFVVGAGDIARGLRSASLAAGDPLAGFAAESGACAGVMSAAVAAALALPVSNRTESEYRRFITAANELCFASDACAPVLAALSNNPQIPASLRLPAPHEWEYVARGGAGDGPATLRPAPPSGVTVRDIANIRPAGSGNQGSLLPIGSTKPYLGLYDLYGNVSELALGYFLAETVSGAVGGLQARGGDITTPEQDLRPSAAAELKPYAAVEGKGLAEAPLALAGLRLFIGSPLAGVASRVGSDELVRIHAAAFSEIGTGQDRAGNSFVDAKSMREMKPLGEAFEDELDASDPADVFRFPLTVFADATVRIRSSAPVVVDVFDEARRPLAAIRHTGGPEAAATEKRLPGLLPGRYYVAVKPQTPPPEGVDIVYGLTMLADKPEDTGLSGLEIGREAFAGKQRTLGPLSLRLDGYVGADDPFDTHAVVLGDGFDAILFDMGQGSPNVDMRILDSRGQKIQSRMMDGSVESGYPVPLSAKAKVFIQVAATDGQPTRYEVTASPARMFDSGLSPSTGISPDSAPARELAGYLHEGAKTLYFRTRLPGRKRLRAELTGLDADVDLAVLDASGNAVSSNHRQTGTEPEVFIKDLPAGDYLVQINRKSGPGTIAPFNLSVFHEQAEELGVADLKSFKDRAMPLSAGQRADIKPASAVSYYYFDAPGQLQSYDITVNTLGSAAARVTLETADGAILAVQDNVRAETLKYYGGPSSGRTYIRLEFSEAPPTSMQIHIRSTGAVPGRSTDYNGGSKAGDWTYGELKDECFAYTHATDFAPPQGWVKERPYFLITVTRGGSGAFIGVVDGSDFDMEKAPAVSVRDRKGKQRSVSLVWHGNYLKPVTYNKKAKQYFLNSGAIRQLIGGQDVVIDGRTKTGLPARLSYSLSGLGETARSLVKMCKLKNNPFN